MSGLGLYRPLSALREELATLGDEQVYGRSVEDRELIAYSVGEGPTVMVTAGLHGIEFIGVETAVAVLRAGAIPGLRLLVCPVLNPDAYARTWSSAGRGALADLRKNARGVDLNRNFPMPWGAVPTRIPFAGSGSPTAATYRGPHALSEPESKALVALMEAEQPVGSVNLHSFMGTQITPRVRHLADWRVYTSLCQTFRSAQGGRGYPRLATPIGDVFTGELEDWQHHVLGCWAVCIECFSWSESLRQHLRAPSTFWRFNPRQPDDVASRDAPAVRAWLSAAAGRGSPPRRAGAQALPMLAADVLRSLPARSS